jgi:hypothetical protein
LILKPNQENKTPEAGTALVLWHLMLVRLVKKISSEDFPPHGEVFYFYYQALDNAVDPENSMTSRA